MAHWANPMESKIKKGLSSQKKRMVGPKDLKSKSMKGQILRATLGNLERRTTRGSSWENF